MKIKYVILAGMLYGTTLGLQAQVLPYKNAKLPIEDRVVDLLSRMTVEEKVGQLSKLLGWEMYEKDTRGIRVSQKLKDAVKKATYWFIMGYFKSRSVDAKNVR